LKKLKQIYEAWATMTKLKATSLYFHQAAIFLSPSFPILKTFPCFSRDSIIEMKVPKGLLKQWQKCERQAGVNSNVASANIVFQLETRTVSH